MSKIQKVPPNSVHVWRGFRSPQKTQAQFEAFLGEVFVPGCTLLQPNAGLHAYVPSLPDQANKPAGVPDQSALMFWTDQETYHDAFKCVAVRCYTNLHGDLYDTTRSKAEFPVLFAGEVKEETPYYLIDAPADWMIEEVDHFIGARNGDVTSDDFQSEVATWAKGLQSRAGLDGGLFCIGADYIVAWVLWGAGADKTGAFDGLSGVADACLNRSAESYTPPAGLWTEWPAFRCRRPIA